MLFVSVLQGFSLWLYCFFFVFVIRCITNCYYHILNTDISSLKWAIPCSNSLFFKLQFTIKFTIYCAIILNKRASTVLCAVFCFAITLASSLLRVNVCKRVASCALMESGCFISHISLFETTWEMGLWFRLIALARVHCFRQSAEQLHISAANAYETPAPSV